MNQEQHTTEVRDTTADTGNDHVSRQTVTHSDTAPGSVIARRVVWYIAGFIISLLALRMLLLLLGANEASPFVSFIYGLSGIFAAPFYGIFNYQPVYGNSVFEISSVVAMIIYALIAWGIAKLLTLGSSRADV